LYLFGINYQVVLLFLKTQNYFYLVDNQMNILILFTELAGYFIACVNELAQQTGATVHIVRLPVNKEAPFEFDIQHKNVVLHDRESFTDNELVDVAIKLNPSLILCSGWKDKAYMKIAKHFHHKVPTVLAFDNKWENTLKQNVASIISPFHIRNKFSHCFVPGPLQATFARKLGFKQNEILTGVYSCDFSLFDQQYHKNLASKNAQPPHRFLFIGRYYDFKGCTDLWEAFIELKNEEKDFDWELWCCGTGSIEPMQHEGIQHFGFIQPEKLPQFIIDSSVFVMPSHIEPWGVVLHEMAAAGMPVIASSKVGATAAFLEDGKNGFVFEPSDKIKLKALLKKFSMMSAQELSAMSVHSNQLASRITPTLWAKQLKALMSKKQA
jgi:glycosyltransferase involved in cell wall biosynthesis